MTVAGSVIVRSAVSHLKKITNIYNCLIVVKDFWPSTTRRSRAANLICQHHTLSLEPLLCATCWCNSVPASISSSHNSSASLLTCVSYVGCMVSLALSSCCLRPWPCLVESRRTGSRAKSVVRRGMPALHVRSLSTARLQCRCWAPRARTRVPRTRVHRTVALSYTLTKLSSVCCHCTGLI